MTERTINDRSKLFFPIIILSAWTAFGLFFGTQSYVRDLYVGRPASLPGHIVGWLICGYSWAALTAPILVFLRRFSLLRVGWSKFLLINLFSAIPIVFVQLGIYVLISSGLPGTSGRGLLELYELVVVEEFQSSFLVYVVLVAVVTGYDRFFKVSDANTNTNHDTDSLHTPASQNGNSGSFLRRIPVKDNGRITLVDSADIDWVEAYGNYVFLHVPGRRHIVRETMTAMEKKLDPKRFVRIRRSAIVQIDRIDELRARINGEFDVVLKNGTVLPSTRRYRKNLDAILKA